MSSINEIIAAFQEVLRLAKRIFPLRLIVAAVAFVIALIWYSLRKK